ncbi:hypothetical protein [Seonamhaeicola sp. ML3]|uniref:hypothetical protein n=1 Tax=Seonamhaeicola sp. ML3 TaxID=2937786 RepID=UPI00200ECC09|nr:hypothetical protein [Seonamhaeicola sp. ML3]
MKYSRLFLIISFFIFSKQSFGQKDDIFFNKIKTLGELYTGQLREGKIDGLKNVKPPVGTWVYSKLEAYKNVLNENRDRLTFGSFIEESILEEGFFAYNFFVYDVNKKEPYYLVAVISINTNKTPFEVNNSYLFTEKESLKDWWRHVFSFYHSEYVEKIPKAFLYPILPPPPYKE